MAFRGRRLFCFLTALLFAVGSVGHVHAITDTLVKMPAAAMDSVMPDHDPEMDCGGSDKAAKANCVAMCATSIAILAAPVTVPVVVVLDAVRSVPELPLSEREPRPEPHPPRT